MTTAPVPTGSGTDSRILSVIGIGHGMSHLYYLVLAPLFPHLRDAFGVSYAELGIALALMPLTSAVLQVPIGFMVDRLGARAMLIGGLAIVSISTALMGFCTSYQQLLLLCIVSGAGNAVFHPTDYAILNSSISPERMGRAFSIHTFSGQIGTAAAPVVMIALNLLLGWRMALVAIGLVGFVALALVLSQLAVLRDETNDKPRKVKSQVAETPPKGSTLRAAVTLVLSPPMLMFFVFFTVLSMMQTGMQAFTATALVALHDIPLATANLALSAFLFASAAGVLVGGEISDRWERHDLLAGVVFLVSGAIALLIAWFNLHTALLIAVMIVMGLGLGATRPARDMMLRAATPKGSTGSVFGFVTSGIALGSALAPIPLGWLIDIGRPQYVFYALAGFMALALVSMMGQRFLAPSPSAGTSDRPR
jgi:FSR family fosmidomycin resistance protein-like MFS transporter